MYSQTPTTFEKGFTLIELVIVIIIAGILATVAVRKMTASIDAAKYEQTKKELDQLAYAVAGNPDLYAKGARTDFGYVGDIGALPPNLDALVQNPGGYSTWNGPYIDAGFGGDDFKRDAWNIPYTYTDTLLRSTGSGSNIDKVFANSSAELLSNVVSGFAVDADNTMPGSTYKDSMVILFTYPDGSGSTTTVTVNPDEKGNFNFSGIPIGLHTLRVIYVPDTDTVSFIVGVTPGSTVKLPIIFPADLW
jgi:prepilin-type N-terminal cleavage/methylation domain-containing protein